MKLATVLDLRAGVGTSPAYNELVKKTYVIEATPDVLARFEQFMSHLQYCGGVGHSTTVGMDIDGDGADRFHVLSPKLHSGGEATNRRGTFETGN